MGEALYSRDEEICALFLQLLFFIRLACLLFSQTTTRYTQYPVYAKGTNGGSNHVATVND
jgi:hypothetical protein